ncbi:hypothetical protein CHUAL_013557 [Chamberlinius hualienensis]
MWTVRNNIFRVCLMMCRQQRRCLNHMSVFHKVKFVKIENLYYIGSQRLCRFSSSSETSDKTVLSTTANDSLSSTEDDDSAAKKAAPSATFVESLSPEDNRRLQLLRMELEVFRLSGASVPITISDGQWEKIMALTSKTKRLQFYRFLCINEHRKLDHQEKKVQRSLELAEVRKKRDEEMKLDPEKYTLEYGISRNTLFLRINDARMTEIYNNFMCQAILYGQKLVFDFSYSHHMTERELMNCADQLTEMYGFNRENRIPFNLYFCNLLQENLLHKYLLKAVPNLYSHNCLINVTEKSYFDLFPKEQLVYLTPDCKNDIQKFDHDAIYIIGALVDKGSKQPLSLAKAKQENIKMARLPLDYYLEWGSGDKTLTLDQMLKILLEIKNTNDWNTAFKHVPKRKLKSYMENKPFIFDKKRRTDRLFGQYLRN